MRVKEGDPSSLKEALLRVTEGMSSPNSFIGDPDLISKHTSKILWIPAFAGMTRRIAGMTHQEILTKQNKDTLPQDDMGGIGPFVTEKCAP